MVIILFLVLGTACSKETPEKREDTPPAAAFSGTLVVFIQNINSTGQEKTLIADTIKYFTGEEAAAAYYEDHRKEIDERTFYIRNTTIDSVNYFVSDSVNIITKTLNYDSGGDFNLSEGISLEKFGVLFSSENYSFYKQIPFKLKLINGVVEVIEEIYIP